MTDRALVLTGWWLFVACAVLFLLGAWRAGDPIGFAGSLCFLAANIAFMIPVYRRPK